MNIYYFGNQVYQFSHSKPIYDCVGGTIIVKKLTKYLPFKINLRNTNFDKNDKTFMNSPKVIVSKPKNLDQLNGLFFSLSNVRLNVGKNSKTVFIGHGTGDKNYGGKSIAIEKYDYLFVTGQKHMAKVQDVGLIIPEEKLIKIGNLRFDDYVNGKYDKNLLMKGLGIRNIELQNVLYAPTWKWGNGTLMKFFFPFAKTITKHFNLIVRPHHFDADKIILLQSWAKLNNIKNLYFSNPIKMKTSDTFQDFAISDIMISDTSSVLYEYLITKKPIIIAIDKFPELHKMPDSLNIMKYTDIYDGSQNIVEMIKQNLVDKEKEIGFNELLNNCFYFNDGKAVQRAVEFVNEVSKII